MLLTQLAELHQLNSTSSHLALLPELTLPDHQATVFKTQLAKVLNSAKSSHSALLPTQTLLDHQQLTQTMLPAELHHQQQLNSAKLSHSALLPELTLPDHQATVFKTQLARALEMYDLEFPRRFFKMVLMK